MDANDHSIINDVKFNSSTVPFTSNLSALLNDPRKDRNKVNHIFTKTWGVDFIENPSFPEFAIKELPIITSNDFKNYLNQITQVR